MNGMIKKYIMKNITDEKQLTGNATEMESKQTFKLLKLLNHSKINVPYYSNFLQNNKIESYKDLTSLPFLTKKNN